MSHLIFAVELYRLQMEQGRLFLHEHPLSATSWGLEVMRDLAEDPRVHKVCAHQCMLGLKSVGDDGVERPSQKPTGFLTNSRALAERLDVKCQGDHDHNILMGAKRTSRAAQYPDELCDAILEGLAEHLEREKSRPVEQYRGSQG